MTSELTTDSEREKGDSNSQVSPLIVPSILVVIPSLNEAGSIGSVLKEVQTNLPQRSEIILVDNSTDDTPIVAAGLGARVITQAGEGKGDALRIGFANRAVKGDMILMMDADGSMRPQEIPLLIKTLETEGVDMVKGSRFMSGGGSTDISRIRRIGNKLFVSLVNLFWHTKYTDLCYGFIGYKADALRKLEPVLESTRFQIETEICIKAKKLGLNVIEVPSLELTRIHGVSKLRGFRDSIQIMKVILHELFSNT